MIPEGEALPCHRTYGCSDSQGIKINPLPDLGYWMDIGRMEDFEKAQQEIKHIRF